MPAPGMHPGLPTDDAMNLAMSEGAVGLYQAVKEFIANEIDPITEEFYRLGEGRADHWGFGDGQLELLDSVKAKAKANGLWNFFLPDAETGEGLSTSTTPTSPPSWARTRWRRSASTAARPTPATWRCSSGSAPRSRRSSGWSRCWPARSVSAFAMTEPDVASSDAKNIRCSAVLDGGGMGHQRREVLHLRRR